MGLWILSLTLYQLSHPVTPVNSVIILTGQSNRVSFVPGVHGGSPGLAQMSTAGDRVQKVHGGKLQENQTKQLTHCPDTVVIISVLDLYIYIIMCSKPIMVLYAVQHADSDEPLLYWPLVLYCSKLEDSKLCE